MINRKTRFVSGILTLSVLFSVFFSNLITAPKDRYVRADISEDTSNALYCEPFWYELQSDGSCKITSMNSSLFIDGGLLVVPTYLDGHRVDVIGQDAISQINVFTSITIEEGVTKIETMAFYKTRCKQITLPSTLTYIGDMAFQANTTLQSMAIPASVTYIGKQAFYNCVNCNLTYYDTATVGTDAFTNVKSVTKLTNPNPGNTPVPQTPVPETPVPETPVPQTPVPGTPVPGTPVPQTPSPDNPGPGTPTPAPINDAAFGAFIDRLYNVALNRASEPEGKAYWLDAVINKGFTGADCARFFLLDAPEFMARNLSDSDFVETLYLTFFDRPSEEAGKAYWLGRLAAGTPRADLVNDFIESTEWCNVCASYGVKSGAIYHKATIPSANAVKFATRLYTCCLGRDPEQDGLNYWALALTNREASGYEAAKLFFESPEFLGFNTSNEQYLTRLYTTFMGRDPEADGFSYWLGQLNSGANRADVLVLFAGSPEFRGICLEYGMEPGI